MNPSRFGGKGGTIVKVTKTRVTVETTREKGQQGLQEEREESQGRLR